MSYSEILYEKSDGVARVTINRPKKYNACSPVTLMELGQALTDAGVDNSAGVVVFTGAGERAFCTGGDQSIRDEEGSRGTNPGVGA
jgi:1,4-dihydroxy-2-naphthoyl-CoA synthase